MVNRLFSFPAVVFTCVVLYHDGYAQHSVAGGEVKIGNQVWMAKNLNVEKFRNGDPIPQVTSDEEWSRAGTEGRAAWCYYENDPANGKVYGKLYNWFAVTDPRGLAPEGWHIPTDKEWQLLEESAGVLGAFELKATSGWLGKGNGNNKLGFGALPGGDRVVSGAFHSKGKVGSWWSVTPNGAFAAWDFYLNYKNSYVGMDYNNKDNGFSVRCVKD